jgi:hypothetical protein
MFPQQITKLQSDGQTFSIKASIARQYNLEEGDTCIFMSQGLLFQKKIKSGLEVRIPKNISNKFGNKFNLIIAKYNSIL